MAAAIPPDKFDAYTRDKFARLPESEAEHVQYKAHRQFIVEMRAHFGFDPIQPGGKVVSARPRPGKTGGSHG